MKRNRTYIPGKPASFMKLRLDIFEVYKKWLVYEMISLRND